MHELEELLDRLDPFTTVMVVGVSEERRRDLLQRLNQAGANIVGPVDRASFALALAAHSHADLAIIETELAGVRDGHALARALEGAWGVTSLVIADGEGPGRGRQASQERLLRSDA